MKKEKVIYGALPGEAVDKHLKRFGHLPTTELCNDKGDCTTKGLTKEEEAEFDKKFLFPKRVSKIGVRSYYRHRWWTTPKVGTMKTFISKLLSKREREVLEYFVHQLVKKYGSQGKVMVDFEDLSKFLDKQLKE